MIYAYLLLSCVPWLNLFAFWIYADVAFRKAGYWPKLIYGQLNPENPYHQDDTCTFLFCTLVYGAIFWLILLIALWL